MPVRFKGLSEYKRNFKWKKSHLSEFCNPSQEQKSSRAGLRSDQLGITREPNFISKRRVPYFNPQISESFEWRGDSDLEGYLDDAPEIEGAGPAESHTNNHSNDRNLENIETPEAPRLPKKIRSHSADSRIESAITLAENSRKKLSPPTPVNQKAVFVPPKKHLEKMDNGVGSFENLFPFLIVYGYMMWLSECCLVLFNPLYIGYMMWLSECCSRNLNIGISRL
uniref:Nuclear protein MDM1 n=1 Tax=Gopherus agassizii TaxID=38772 RepID=A0A452J2J5_9SAUR